MDVAKLLDLAEKAAGLLKGVTPALAVAEAVAAVVREATLPMPQGTAPELDKALDTLEARVAAHHADTMARLDAARLQ